jgi:DNA-binding beta-propeller fold protein YncE
VIKTPLGYSGNVFSIVAGTGVWSSDSECLAYPQGIFVTVDLNLYVADCGNDRVQMFPYGEKNGSTVAGEGAAVFGNLSCPTDIVVDMDNNIYITDKDHHRIVVMGTNGFQCLFGCSGIPGSGADQLHCPTSISFDNAGNLFVVDSDNDRIQKFLLIGGQCSKYDRLNSFL